MVMNSLNFCLRKPLFIYNYWQSFQWVISVFFFNKLKMRLYSLLASIVSEEKSGVILTSLCGEQRFHVASSKISSLFLTFCGLNRLCLVWPLVRTPLVLSELFVSEFHKTAPRYHSGTPSAPFPYSALPGILFARVTLWKSTHSSWVLCSVIFIFFLSAVAVRRFLWTFL